MPNTKLIFRPTLDFLIESPIDEKYEYRSDGYLYIVCTHRESGEIMDTIRTNRKRKGY